MGPLDQHAIHHVAVLEAGPRAYLDGASSLVEGGLKGFDVPVVRVSVPRGAKLWRVRGIDAQGKPTPFGETASVTVQLAPPELRAPADGARVLAKLDADPAVTGAAPGVSGSIDCVPFEDTCSVHCEPSK